MCLCVFLRVLEAFRQHVEISHYKLHIVAAADNFRRWDRTSNVCLCRDVLYGLKQISNLVSNSLNGRSSEHLTL